MAQALLKRVQEGFPGAAITPARHVPQAHWFWKVLGENRSCLGRARRKPTDLGLGSRISGRVLVRWILNSGHNPSASSCFSNDFPKEPLPPPPCQDSHFWPGRQC